MSEIIRIPNIENYAKEIVNGELILTPKKLNNIPEDAWLIAYENYYMGKLMEYYECEITELSENCERREHLRRQITKLHQIKVSLKQQFAKKFEANLWYELLDEIRKYN